MTDYNRGPNRQGAEPPLSFEGRRPPSRGGPPPVTLILSLLLLAAVGGGVYFMYRGGARSPGEPPQPIGAPVRDVKVAAPPEAPTADPAAGLSVYNDAQDAAGAPAFVPPPEQPAPRPATGEASVANASPGSIAPSAMTSSGPPTSPPATVPGSIQATKPSHKPVSIDTILADNSEVKPVAKVSVTSSAAKPDSPAKVAPTIGKTAGQAVSAVVQIGAYSSKALADAGWNAAAVAAPGAMAGKGKRVIPVTKADGSILYRTSITGFASRAEADALCGKLKGAGQTCFVR